MYSTDEAGPRTEQTIQVTQDSVATGCVTQDSPASLMLLSTRHDTLLAYPTSMHVKISRWQAFALP